MYERELKEARNILDDVAKEKAQLQIEISTLRDRADSEMTRYNQSLCSFKACIHELREQFSCDMVFTVI